ncbi:MAG: hypothetical protein IPN33_10985 [Saprospiraceae bacterium]|nr:hypothetical protein [Saprospiraceae bacterium]
MADLIGYIGVFLILLAYFLSVYGKLSQSDSLYLILNLVGAGLACISSILIQSIPFTILEGAWALVSLLALWKNHRKVS